jgi:serpin B
VHAVDFKTQASNVTKKINDWVSETTKQRIKDLLGPDVLTADTLLVLVNAIYFKGAWVHEFEESNTDKATFYAAANKEIKVSDGY